MTYYNDIDGRWLPGADERDVSEVRPADVAGFTRCHFFAGIGAWELALQLAGWSEDAPVWTASLPCQPFSHAGEQRGTDDARHLWPVFRDLLEECRPPIVFGEQVASELGRAWLAAVQADLEALGYSTAAADLCAAGVGAPHIRQRLYWVGHADGARPQRRVPAGGPGEGKHPERAGPDGPWSRVVYHPCTDGRTRPLESRILPVVDGTAPGMADQIRAYGNAIVPQVAALFIRSTMEALCTSQ